MVNRRKKSLRTRIRLVRLRKSYTTSEMAQLLNVHPRTVQTWHKLGMFPLDPNERPYLFLGSEVKSFLTERQKAKRFKLKENEFYCVRCKQPRLSLPDRLLVFQTQTKIGKNKIMVLIRGICHVCGCQLARFSTTDQTESQFSDRKSKRHQRRLKDNCCTLLNTDLFEGVGNVNQK